MKLNASRICHFLFAVQIIICFIGRVQLKELEHDAPKGSQVWRQLMGIIRDNKNASAQLKSYIQNKQQNGYAKYNDSCSPPCANEGICIGKDKCKCVNNWYGPTCAQFDCADNCEHGTCMAPDTCFCNAGWTGITCSKPICNPSCLNKGVCVEPDDCRCDDGYSGRRCQDAICDPSCAHGSCYKPNQCVCDPWWQGDLCQIPKCSPVCHNGGTCVGPNTCSCTKEWRGYSCDIPICKTRCQNGGSCVSPDVCQCTAKFEGEYCQIALDREAQAGRTCTVWNSYHFRTFDGYTFDFPGNCRYDLCRDVYDGLFSIELVKDKKLIRFVASPGVDPSYGDVHLNGLNGDSDHGITGEFMAIVLAIRGMSPSVTLLPDRKFLIGDKMITDSHYAHDGISVETIGRYLRVKTRYGISILWDGQGAADITLDNDQYSRSLGGLCGNFNSDPIDDMVMRDGSAASDILDFAIGWRIIKPGERCVDVNTITPACGNRSSEQLNENNVVCDVVLLQNSAFQDCRDRDIDATPFASACKADMCKCESEDRIDCACKAMIQYSRLCSHETGLSPKWRKPNLCRVQCPIGMVYDECGSSCPRTCESLVMPETNCDERCIDGCICANGTVLRNDNVCVPEERCPCMRGNVSYQPGEMFQENCLECQCMGALWNCRNRHCPGECSAVGDSHYTTFDGLLSKLYGECQFTFVKDCSGNDLFSVVVDNSLCANDQTETCITEVLVITRPITSSASSARTTRTVNGHNDIKISLEKSSRVSINDQKVVLPQMHEHYQIFQVSSEFIQLRLNLGVTIEWNGKSRLYVKADQKWMDQVCGVCGNFNENKRDDLMNMDGLIEKSSVTFSNLWKTDASCKDATSDQSFDPCVLNPEKAQLTKDRCGILKSGVFRKCHPFVNPEDADIICRHDVCQCDTGADCYCNAISHYARLCAKKGQIIDWRTDELCPVICTGGKTYQQCGSSCTTTCRSISEPEARCSESCIEGCNCPPNTYLNEYDICVPRSNCQCYHNGNIYQPLHIRRRENSVCHCRGGQYSCHTTSDWNTNSTIPLPINGTQCPNGWQFYSCDQSLDALDGPTRGIECQKTCSKLHQRCVAYECTSGCGCPSNLVLDDDSKSCIDKSQCPCHYRGRSYRPGEITQDDCNTCVCRNREWVCSNNSCSGTCIAYGDPHFKTFDGYKFNFMGQCGYILTQDYCGNHEGQFRVYVENSNCGSNGVSCTKSVTITFTGNVFVKLHKDNFGYTMRKLVTWGVLPGSSVNHTSILWDYHEAGIYTIVTTNIGVTVVWDRLTTVYVKLEPKHQGRVCGLCGNFDRNENDDMMMSDRMLAINPTDFANSWKVAPSCQDAVERDSECTRHPQRNIWAQHNCKILYDPTFAVCHSVVDVVWYHSNCIFDACSCDNGGDCDCLCTAIAAYALACAEQGIKIRWRTDKICPLMCEAYESTPGECTWHYNECGPVCPETCQHQHSQNSYTCSVSMPCVEGCFPVCPNGTIYDEISKRCVTRCGEGCRANGRYYGFGQTVSTSGCNVCKCMSSGVVECVGSPKCVPIDTVTTTTSPGISVMPTTTSTEFSQPTTVSGLFSTTTTAFIRKSKVLSTNFPERHCSGKVRLGFVLDGSRRVSSREFETIKVVIEGLTGSIMPTNYGQNNSSLKVAISQIGYETETALRFQSKQDALTLNSTIQDLELQNAQAAKINTALEELLDEYRTEISEEGNDSSLVTDRVLFLVTYTPADQALGDALRNFQAINVRLIILSSGDGPSKAELQEILTSSSVGYHIDSMEDFTEDEDMPLQVLETICDGEFVQTPNTTTTPRQVVTTTLPPTTTSIHQPDETCTMQADLVIIIDLQLLKNSETENAYFMQLLRSVTSQILVTPDRTHITILLADLRVWRIARFVSIKEDLISVLDGALSQQMGLMPEAEHFNLQFALVSAAEVYLLNGNSGARTSDGNVQMSILVFHSRPAYIAKPSDGLMLDKTLRGLTDNDIVLTVVTQTGIFPSDIAGKTDWISTVSSENLIFGDISHQAISRTTFERILEKVCRSPPHFPIRNVYCDGKMDLVFLLDHSNSVSFADLHNMIEATVKIIESLEPTSLGSNENATVRISIAEFGNKTNFLLKSNQLYRRRVYTNVQWNLGDASNLGNALSQIATNFLQSRSSRNKTLIVFTSNPSSDDILVPTQRLKEIDVNRVIIGFGQDVNTEELKSIAGEDGLYRKIASSKEILANDLGVAIVESICTPAAYTPPRRGRRKPTPAPVPTEVISTHASPVPTASEGPVAACSMTSDMVVVYDSSLSADNSTLRTLEEILQNLEIGNKKQSSRVGIVTADENPMILSDLDQGSNKGFLMEKLNELRNIDQYSTVSFPLVKTMKMANEFVLKRRRRSYDDIPVKKDILLITDRLPNDESNLIREDSLDSVKSTIADFLEQDVNVYMIYKGNTFQRMSNDMKSDWLRNIKSNSFHLEDSDNPETFGDEVLDVMCSVPITSNVTVTPSVPVHVRSTEPFTEISTHLPYCLMDVEIIVDSSYSIGLQFGPMKEFLMELMNNLNIDEDVVRVGLVQYSVNTVSEFRLGDYIKNSTMMKESISRLHPLGSTSNTYSAIEYVFEHELTKTSGRRRNVPLSLLLLTDGRIKDLHRKSEVFRKLNEVRTKLENAGTFLNVLVIGFGSADPAELSELADNGIFMEESTKFTSDYLTNDTSKKLCSRPVRPTGTPVVTATTTPAPVCSGMPPTDVLFVFDGALDAIENGNVNQVYRDFMQSMIEMFRIGSKNTQVGVSFYADQVVNTLPNGFGISRFMSEEELKSAVSGMEVPVGFSEDIVGSIDEVLSSGFSNRDGVRKVGVVFLKNEPMSPDGKSPADVFSDASDVGVESVVVLAADNEFFNTLIDNAVGSSVNESNKLTVPGGWQNLKSITESLKDIICGEIRTPETITTPTPYRSKTTMPPVPPECSISTDILVILDNSIFNQPNDVLQFISDIEDRIVVDETHAQIGIINANGLSTWKSITGSQSTASDVIRNAKSQTSTDVIDIGLTIDTAIEAFEYAALRNVTKRQAILIIQSEVRGSITFQRWEKLQELRVSFIVIALDTSFLRSTSTMWINLLEIPITSSNHLSRTTDAVVSELCKESILTTEISATKTTSPTLICPPGDVVIMYDATLMAGDSEQALVSYLSKLVSLLSNTYSRIKTRFALITIGDEPTLQFGLSSARSPAQVARMIRNAQHVGGTDKINAGKALTYAVQRVASLTQRGHEFEHTTLTIMTLLTKPSDDDMVTVVSNIGRSADIITLAVGYTEPNLEELTTVRFGGVPVSSFRRLEHLEYETLELICSKPPDYTTLPSTTLPRVTQPRQPCKIDVVFMVDEDLLKNSRTVANIRSYLKAVANRLYLGEEFFMIKIKRFSSESQNIVNSFVGGPEDLNDQLDDLMVASPVTGPLNLQNGLNDALQEFEDNGRLGNDVGNIVVFILKRRNAKAFDVDQLISLNERGVTVFNMLVNDAMYMDQRPLRNYLSQYRYTRAYLPRYLTRFAPRLVYYLWNAMCAKRPVATLPYVETPIPKPNVTLQCSREMDVAYIIDDALLTTDFEKENLKDLIKDTIREFELGPHKTQICLLQYSSVPKLLIGLNKVYSIKNVFRAIDEKVFLPSYYKNSSDGSFISTALTYVSRQILRPDGSRNCTKYIVLFTKTHFQDDLTDLSKAAIELYDNNILLILVTTLDNDDTGDKLQPYEKLTFSTSNDLVYLRTNVTTALCEEPLPKVLPRPTSSITTATPAYPVLTSTSMEEPETPVPGQSTSPMSYSPYATATATIPAATPTTVSAKCAIRTDIVFVLDNSILNETNDISEFVSDIESRIVVDERHARIGIIGAHDRDLWKPIAESQSIASDVIKNRLKSPNSPVIIDIGMTVESIIEELENAGTEDELKKQAVLILQSEVQGSISLQQWVRLQQLDVSLIVIAVDARFLQTASTKWIRLLDIPMISPRHLLRTSDAVVSELCRETAVTTQISSTATTVPNLICPPGDVVIMYDAMLLAGDSELILKSYLKKLVSLLSNTYSRIKTRFALISFGNEPTLQFGLSSTRPLMQVRRLIQNSQHTGATQQLNVGKALTFATEEVANPTLRGNLFKNTTLTIMMLLSRSSDDDVQSVVKQIGRSADVITLAVGYTEPDLKLLTTVSFGDVSVSSVERLEHLEYETLEVICSSPPDYTTLPTTTLPSVTRPTHPCKIDILVMVDEDLLKNSQTITSIKKYLKAVASRLVFGEDFFKIKVKKFSSTGQDVLPRFADSIHEFNTELEKTVVTSPVTGSLNYQSGLDSALDEFEQNGRQANDVGNVIMFLLKRRNRESFDIDRLRFLNARGVTVFNMLVNDAMYMNLRPLKNHLSHFRYTRAYLPRYLERFSSRFVYYLWNAMCANRPNATLPYVETPMPKPTITLQCSREMDITYIVDDGLLVSNYEKSNLKEFIKDTVREFELGPHKTRISLLQYSSVPRLRFNLDKVFTIKNVFRAVDELLDLPNYYQDSGNENFVSTALRYASRHILRTDGSRNCTKYIVLFSKNGFNDDMTSMYKAGLELYDDDITLILLTPPADITKGSSLLPCVKWPFTNSDDLARLLPNVSEALCEELSLKTSPRPTMPSILTTARSKEPAQTSSPYTTSETPSAAACQIRADILLVFDNSIFLEPNDHREFISDIEQHVAIDDRHARIGIISANDHILWKAIASQSSLSTVMREMTNSRGSTDVIDIGTVIDGIIKVFENADSEDTLKRQVVLILQSEVQGSISAEEWIKLEQLDVSMTVIAVNTTFLQSASTKWIRLLQIPMISPQHLSRTSNAVVSEICRVPVVTTEITQATVPTLICPPGDVVIMYDARLLAPHSEQILKSYLKKLVILLSNSYSRVKTRFALITFGNEPTLQFGLSDTRSPTQVARRIQNSRHTGSIQQLNAAKALTFATEEVANPEQRGNLFKNTTLTIMMLLSRSSNDDIISVIEKIGHSADVITLAVGYSEPQLDQLTTVQFGDIPVSSVKKLEHLEYETLELICSSPPDYTTMPVTTLPTVTRPKQPCKIDIVFMVDEDLMKSSQMITSVKRYLKAVANHLVFGEDFFKINIKKFSSTSQDIFHGFVDSLSEFNSVLDDSMVASPVTGSLNMQSGLNSAMDEFERNGRTGNDVGNVVVFLLKRQNRESFDIDKLKAMNRTGITLFNMMVNDAMYMNQKPLREYIARYRYMRAYLPRYMENFSQRLVYYLWNAMCAKRPVGTLPYVETPIPKPTVPLPCSRVMDIVFIVDDAMLMDHYEKENLKHFIKDMIREVELSPQKTRISVLQYSSIPSLSFNLNKVFTIEEVFHAIDDKVFVPSYYQPSNNETFISSSLSYATRHILRADGSRDSAKSIVLFSKAAYNDDVHDLHEAGLELYDNNVTLILLTSPANLEDAKYLLPDTEFTFANSDDLTRLRPNVTKVLCAVPLPKKYPRPTTASITTTFFQPLTTTPSTTISTTTQPVDCTNIRLDLMVLVQATTYFSYHGEDAMKSFVNSIVNKFSLGDEAVRLSMLQFTDVLLSDLSNFEGFDFDDIADLNQLPSAIFDLVLRGGNHSNPGLALKTAINNHLTADHGARDGVRKAVVMILGGNMTQNATDELNEAIGDAINRRHSVFIIGIPEKSQSVQTQELLTKLNQIPAANKMYARNAFHDLLNRTVVAEFAEKICTDIPHPVLTTTSPTQTPQEPFTATSRMGTATQITTSLQPEKCPHDLSLALLIDVSNLADNKISEIKRFILRILDALTLKPDRSNVAIYTFSSTAKKILGFPDGRTWFPVRYSMRSIQSFGKITNTGAGLRAVADAFQSARRDTNWVTVLITDGRAKDDLQVGISAFDALRQQHANTKIVAVGLQMASRDQLSMIADDMLTVDAYERLSEEGVFETIATMICTPSSLPTPEPRVPLFRCNKRMDVVFVLDKTLSSEWLNGAKKFIDGLGYDLHINQNYTRSVLVPYGTEDASVPSTWTEDLTQLKKSVDEIKRVPPGSSDVASALSTVQNLDLIERNDAGPSSTKVEKTVVVFLSDSSTGIVDTMIQLLQEQDFQFIVVGLGYPRTSLVRRFKATKATVYEPDTRSELINETLPDILDKLCGAPPTPPPSMPPTPGSSGTASASLPETPQPYTGTAITTPSEYTPSPISSTTSVLPGVSTTSGSMAQEHATTVTTPVPGITCKFYDNEAQASLLLQQGDVVHPKKDDKCLSWRCIGINNLQYENKRLICAKLPKPTCKNRFDPVLSIDESCNCQWECPCYCQSSSMMYHTFDGFDYPTDGECDQVVVQGSERAHKNYGRFSVKSRKEECGQKKCITQVELNWRQDRYIFDKSLQARLNGTLLDLKRFEGSAEIDIVGEMAFVVKIDDIGLQMQYTPFDNILTVSLPANIWSDDTQGLCGTCNQITEDEMQMRNRHVTDNVTDFLKDWTEGEACHVREFPSCLDDKPTKCELIKNITGFESCRQNLDWERYYNACKTEVCGKPELLCESLAEFADACQHQGYCADWRSPDFCPINCTSGRVYKACVSAPYEKSCKNETRTPSSKQEGCFMDCAENEVVINGKCVNDKNCSMCYDHESGDYRQAGEVWVPQSPLCSVCNCDSTSLTIECQPRTCQTTATKPTCGVCEKVGLKEHSDPCCPDYECTCDYENCKPTLQENCVDGMTASFQTKNDSCLPVAECICDLDRCVNETDHCESPMVPTEKSTSCCSTYACTCPQCNKNVTECDVGYAKHVLTDRCNCSVVRCERMPVCIVNSGDQTGLRRPGETWADQANRCVSCECQMTNSDYTSSCVDASTNCTRCPEGFKSEKHDNECCPKCVQEACVTESENGTSIVHQVGHVWKEVECQDLTCKITAGRPVVTGINEPCDREILLCPFGYFLQCDDDPCCPTCLCEPDAVCLYNGTSIQKPGQNWTVDECTTCNCKHTKGSNGFNEHECTTETCDSCGEGFKRHMIDGSCCGQCIPTVCNISISESDVKSIQIGDEFREKCMTYKCIENDKGGAILAELNVSCSELNRDTCRQQGGEVVFDESGCCLTCNFDKRECQPRNGTLMRISVNDCTSNEEVLIPRCEGQCSSTTHYDGPTDDFNQYCSCCKPILYENKTAIATCTNGSKVFLSYRYIQNCSCDKVVCTEWKRLRSSDQIFGYNTESSNMPYPSSSVVSLWKSDRTIHVVEIRDIDRRVEFDLKSVIRDAIQDLNIQDFEINIVQVSAKDTRIQETTKQAFLRSVVGSRKTPSLPP